MAERPRSRATIIAGGVTIFAMLLIATIFLLIQSPWNDRHPRPLAPTGHATSHKR